jgi:hypothetical protein
MVATTSSKASNHRAFEKSLPSQMKLVVPPYSRTEFRACVKEARLADWDIPCMKRTTRIARC